jgi:DNA-directed RNA polymerase subunit RPC12/RpoP
MKPKTRLQFRVAQLANDLHPISKKQKEWAYIECLEHRGYATKNKVLCLDCGETFSPNLVIRKKAVCPHCNTKIQVKQSRCTTDTQTNYFAITEIVEEFQVVRNFEVNAYYKKGIPVKYHLQEIIQYWIQPDLKTTLFGLSHHTQGYCDSWSGSMEIRTENARSWRPDKYDVYARRYHPDSEIKPEYKKYGINHKLKGLSFLEAIRMVPQSSKLETLLKAKQYGLLVLGNSYRIDTFWSTFKICIRNKYYPKDHVIYLDYLELLKYFKKDIRNAKYVCPKDLKKAHDILVRKKREILRLEEREREKQAALKRQERLEQATVEYVQRMQKFFDLEFKNGNISITVLKSIDEFKQEGDELKHCVFTNEYYLKEKSLILSAKVDGIRAETIEVKIPEMKIEQSRGLKNNPTEHHDKIIKLLNKNLNTIREIVIKTRPKSKEKAAA